GYRWPADVILTTVRWYLAYPLSSRQVLELLAERGIDVSHRTVLDWVQAFGPQLAAAVRRHGRSPADRPTTTCRRTFPACLAFGRSPALLSVQAADALGAGSFEASAAVGSALVREAFADQALDLGSADGLAAGLAAQAARSQRQPTGRP